MLPIAAAAACVVGAGNEPILVTPRAATYSRIARLALPFGREPPAITSRLPTEVTAAYRSGDGKWATTRAGMPGRQETIVSSQRLPV